MNQLRPGMVIVEALLTPGRIGDEVIAEMGSCSAFIDTSFVVGHRPKGPKQAGKVWAYLIRVEGQLAFVELPGTAIGSLRGWSSHWLGPSAPSVGTK